MKSVRIVFALSLFVLAGCGEKREPVLDLTWRPTLKNPPIREVKVGKEMPVPRMKPNDVIVAVNGICLTKRELDDELLAYSWYLNQDRRIRGNQKQQMYRNFGRRIIPGFIETQALLWEAREKCRLEETNVLAVVEKNVKRNAKHFGLTPEQYDRAVAGGNNAVRRAAEHLLWRDTYLKECFKPAKVITDADVSNVVVQIDAENAEIAASNAVVMARLGAIRQRIAKGEDFGKLADEFGEDASQEKDGTGTWGEISRSDIQEENLAERMFALKKGEVSEVLEENEGYFLVKALEDPKTGEDGKERTIKLARIWLEKEPLIVLADADDLKKDMQRQENDKEIGQLVKELCKKVTVVYPHGTNFWNESK